MGVKMDNFNFKLEDRETPLDVLLELIKKNSIDIYNIPIASLTDQFLEHISKMKKRDMESISSFIVMASELIRIKSKMLLPKDSSGDEEEEDPRQELVNKIIEYQKFKAAAEQLGNMDRNAEIVFFKEADHKTFSQLKLPISQEIDNILDGVTMSSLYKIFEDVLKRCDNKAAKKKRSFKVKRIRFSIEERIEYIRNLLIISERMLFKNIFSDNSSKMEVIVTFSAMLELIKLKEIKVTQDNIFSDIYIYKSGGEAVASYKT